MDYTTLTLAFGQVQFLVKLRPILKKYFRTSFESSFLADHNGPIPSFISHSHTQIQCDFPQELHVG